MAPMRDGKRGAKRAAARAAGRATKGPAGYRERMDYAGAAQRGLPIGSGVMEAACKTLVTERLKRSGMRWREEGGQAILTLRGWAQSGRFAAAWSLLSATYRGEVTVPDDVELPYDRAA